MTRKELATELTRRGYPIAAATLAKMAWQGGGPPFRRWCGRPRYEIDAAMKWAQDRLATSVPLREKRSVQK